MVSGSPDNFKNNDFSIFSAFENSNEVSSDDKSEQKFSDEKINNVGCNIILEKNDLLYIDEISSQNIIVVPTSEDIHNFNSNETREKTNSLGKENIFMSELSEQDQEDDWGFEFLTGNSSEADDGKAGNDFLSPLEGGKQNYHKEVNNLMVTDSENELNDDWGFEFLASNSSEADDAKTDNNFLSPIEGGKQNYHKEVNSSADTDSENKLNDNWGFEFLANSSPIDEDTEQQKDEILNYSTGDKEALDDINDFIALKWIIDKEGNVELKEVNSGLGNSDVFLAKKDINGKLTGEFIAVDEAKKDFSRIKHIKYGDQIIAAEDVKIHFMSSEEFLRMFSAVYGPLKNVAKDSITVEEQKEKPSKLISRDLVHLNSKVSERKSDGVDSKLEVQKLFSKIKFVVIRVTVEIQNAAAALKRAARLKDARLQNKFEYIRAQDNLKVERDHELDKKL
ncbi:MAG: hypothetical protein VX777_07370 [Chlamydiota bacterium]|nr:hypothetical protein [Chlamydiota bacterium]